MSRLRLLDAYCGAGSAASGMAAAWPDAEIVGVDYRPQPHFPVGPLFTFVQADALTFPLDSFDFVWASPPLRAYALSGWRRGHPEIQNYRQLIDQIRGRLIAAGCHWVIAYAPEKVHPGAIRLCGSSFGLDVRRHTWFQCSFPVEQPACRHEQQTLRPPRRDRRGEDHSLPAFGVHDPVQWGAELEQAKEAMGIAPDRVMTRDEVKTATPPAYARYIASFAPLGEGET